jgi:leucyl/phenylalanyl-tRNA--protein transferase
MTLSWLDEPTFNFPAIESALKEPNGLLAAGGDLKPERLTEAYRLGIFPWYERGQPILCWPPDPKIVLFPEDLIVTSSLRKFIRKQQYTISMDRDFLQVINACSGQRTNSDGTWITEELKRSYCQLHSMGVAHSVEVWHQNELVGGLYGLALGQMFFGESMFSHESNTSKLALVFLVKQLKIWNYRLIDCQVSSAHLESLGAKEISRHRFKRYLNEHLDSPGITGTWHPTITKQQLIDEL